MKEKITSLVLVLVVAMSMTVGASAASYIPDDVTYQNLNGQQLAIKTYTLLPDQNPADLYEEDFEHDGFLYSMSDIIKEEQHFQEENLHTEVVTVTTASKNLEDILAELKPTIEFDDGISSGTLSLDHNTIKTEAAGYKSSSYTVTATKNYTGLDRNDSSYIDKTVEKNGRTLSLSNVTWSVESTALVGDELVPATYSAVATYSGTASSTVATGYITTAEYKGTVVSSGISSILYTVTYLGTEIVPVEEEPTFNASIVVIPVIGGTMFIDGNSPIIMSNRKDKEGLFSGLGTGDKILIFHDGIAETYPGRTGAYWCVKLEDGTQADIPEQVIEELTELGWTIVGNEADPDSVTPEPGAYAFEAQYIRTNGGPEDGYPYHTVISSRAELEAYYEAYKDIYSLERRETVYSDSTIGFLDACDKYDNAYFERQNLVLIVLQEGSGSIRHEITDVRRHRIENGALDGWDITIDRKVPEAGSEDMAQWHLFLEVQMGDVIKATDKVWINGKQSERTPAISGLVGISRTPSISAYQDPWGVKLTAKNITPSGLTIVCTQQDGEPTGELQTGSYYGLKMLQDGEWIAVDLLPMEHELAWTSEAWMIPNNTETEWEVNWSRLYGELPAGSYRISKSVMDFRGTGDYDTKTYYAGFDLVDAADTSNVSYEHGGFGVSVPLLSGWEYKVEEYSADGMSYGVSFRPAGEDGWIDFQYWPTFGVCGTGLSMKEFGNGSMGTYDGGAIWNFISYPASKGNFVATTQGVNSWWSRYGETAMEIITQVICTDTIVD